MQLSFGPVPILELQETHSNIWVPLKEPKPDRINVIALLIGILACVLVIIVWICLTPVVEKTVVANPFILLLALFVTVGIHELLHVFVHPKFGLSRNSVIGFCISLMAFYAQYHGILSRNRFLTTMAMPLLVITLLPLLLCAVFSHGSETFAFISAYNALLAGGDIFGIGMILKQVPSNARVQNQGWNTYWSNSWDTSESRKIS